MLYFLFLRIPLLTWTTMLALHMVNDIVKVITFQYLSKLKILFITLDNNTDVFHSTYYSKFIKISPKSGLLSGQVIRPLRIQPFRAAGCYKRRLNFGSRLSYFN